MKSYKEWSKINEVDISTEPWGWEIAGSIDEIIAELTRNKNKYAGNMYGIIGIEKNRIVPTVHSKFSTTPIVS